MGDNFREEWVEKMEKAINEVKETFNCVKLGLQGHNVAGLNGAGEEDYHPAMAILYLLFYHLLVFLLLKLYCIPPFSCS